MKLGGTRRIAIGSIRTMPDDLFGGGAVGSLAVISGTAAAIVPPTSPSAWLPGGRIAPGADPNITNARNDS